jgi:hypothetical protein
MLVDGGTDERTAAAVRTAFIQEIVVRLVTRDFLRASNTMRVMWFTRGQRSMSTLLPRDLTNPRRLPGFCPRRLSSHNALHNPAQGMIS